MISFFKTSQRNLKLRKANVSARKGRQKEITVLQGSFKKASGKRHFAWEKLPQGNFSRRYTINALAGIDECAQGCTFRDSP
jgi:hypothetical protein